MQGRDIDVDDVLEVLLQSEIIEDYPDNYPFPSYLMMGRAKDRALHVVLANTTDDLKIIGSSRFLRGLGSYRRNGDELNQREEVVFIPVSSSLYYNDFLVYR